MNRRQFLVALPGIKTTINYFQDSKNKYLKLINNLANIQERGVSALDFMSYVYSELQKNEYTLYHLHDSNIGHFAFIKIDRGDKKTYSFLDYNLDGIVDIVTLYPKAIDRDDIINHLEDLIRLKNGNETRTKDLWILKNRNDPLDRDEYDKMFDDELDKIYSLLSI